MTECQVCVTFTTKPLVECCHCQFTACEKCVKRYLLSSHFDAHCMNCRKTWERRFLSYHFSNAFLTKDFKTQRANILYERQTSLFLGTMDDIKADMKREKITQQIREMEQEKKKLEQQITNLRLQLCRSHKIPREKSHYVRPCVHPDCKGYIQEHSGECCLCKKFTCVECNCPRSPPAAKDAVLNVPGSEDHVCREEDITSWIEIKKHTKPCPSCHVRIHRISGCNQMWCPQCQTAFNYATGEIERGVIHNPHYVEYLQRNGLENMNVEMPHRRGPCERNRLPSILLLNHAKSRIPHIASWLQFHRFLTHIQAVELPKYRYTTNTDFAELTKHLRKNFLRNKISEEVFKKRTQEIEKKMLKEREYFNIFQTFFTLGVDLVANLLGERIDTIDSEQQKSQLLNFFNQSMEEISYQFQSKLISIDNDFYFNS